MSTLIDGNMVWVAVAIMISFVASFIYFRRLRKKNMQRDEHHKKLYDDFAALYAGAVGVGDRLERMGEKIRILTERQNQLELREPVLRSYKQAKKLLGNGVDIDELMANCSVTRGEAELMMVLHRLEQ